ncbi:MAG: hypothetical protein JNL28_16740 [Planctomycetes bacterium]|nr:hypothetical protein [Planctomycetota bacterium]
MFTRQLQGGRVVSLAAVLACLAGVSSAQSLLTTSGVIVCAAGDPAPDSTGAPIPNLTMGNQADSCVLDELGNVLFRGPVVDSVTPVTGVNDRALFYGSSRATLKMVVRGGGQAPGMATGVLLRTATGSSTGLSSNVMLSPDGRLWFGSKIDDGGVNITAANDDPAFHGPFGSLGLLYRDGDTAPGTGGAQFAQAFSSPTLAFEGMNRYGVIFTRATLVTGTGVPAVTTTAGMNNQQGLWTGLPGALSLIARKSDPIQGLSGEVGIDNGNSLALHMEINNSNKVLFDISCSTLQGAPAATAANDRVLMVHTPGVGNAVLVRESDPAPGTSGGTFNSVSVTDNWGPGVPNAAWLRTDEVIFQTELRGGDTVAGVSDKAIYRGGIGSLALVARRGDVAPGTGGETWNGFNSTNTYHNAAGKVAFQAFLNLGGPVTSSNDSGIWYGTPGSLQLVVREGDAMPGTGGSLCGTQNGGTMLFNDGSQIVFSSNLSGGSFPGNSLWVWDPVDGLRPVTLQGDQVEISPGVFSTLNTVVPTIQSSGNSDGAALGFGHDGTLALRVDFAGTPSTRAIMIVKIPTSTPSTPFCLGDGTGAACPCANTGAAGHGCASLSFAGGAILTSSGIAGASVATDTLVLTATDIPGPGLFFQSTTLAASPINFGDGHLCATGGILRLGVVFPTAGVASYPGGLTPGPIHIGGATSNGDTRHYQCWYRSVPGLCSAQNYNLTQGLTLTWGP